VQAAHLAPLAIMVANRATAKQSFCNFIGVSSPRRLRGCASSTRGTALREARNYGQNCTALQISRQRKIDGLNLTKPWILGGNHKTAQLEVFGLVNYAHATTAEFPARQLCKYQNLRGHKTRRFRRPQTDHFGQDELPDSATLNSSTCEHSKAWVFGQASKGTLRRPFADSCKCLDLCDNLLDFHPFRRIIVRPMHGFSVRTSSTLAGQPSLEVFSTASAIIAAAIYRLRKAKRHSVGA
jgi:hypothetical protein